MRPADRILIADQLRSGAFRPRRARALAVTGDRLVAVGTPAEVLAWRGPDTRVQRLPGGLLLPGFVDAHLHFRGLVRRRSGLDCAGARNGGALLRLLARAAADGEGWLFAHGLEHRRPGFGALPDLAALDRVTAGRPLWLRHRSGHLQLLNHAALRALGLAESASDPGWLERRDGRPTGVVHGGAERIARRLRGRQPPPPHADVAATARTLLKAGVTAFADLTPTNRSEDLPWWQAQRSAGRIPQAVRLWVSPDAEDASSEVLFSDSPDAALAVAGRKFVLRRGAARIVPGVEELAAGLLRAGEEGRPVAVHAVEADALAVLIGACERAAARPGRLPPLIRAEHCNAVPPGLAEALGRLGIAVCVQPAMLWAQGAVYRAALDRTERNWLFPLRRLRRQTAAMALGSDAPAGPLEPLLAVSMAVRRQDRDGGRWPAGERIAPAAALAAATTEAARLSGFGGLLGELRPGWRADACWFRESWEELLAALKGGCPPRPAGSLVAGVWHRWR